MLDPGEQAVARHPQPASQLPCPPVIRTVHLTGERFAVMVAAGDAVVRERRRATVGVLVMDAEADPTPTADYQRLPKTTKPANSHDGRPVGASRPRTKPTRKPLSSNWSACALGQRSAQRHAATAHDENVTASASGGNHLCCFLLRCRVVYEGRQQGRASGKIAVAYHHMWCRMWRSLWPTCGPPAKGADHHGSPRNGHGVQ
jgi:hypothetical protein